MGTIRIKYVRGRPNAKLVFNRIRYFFNKENNFTAEVPFAAWLAIRETLNFAPAPIEEKSVVVPDDAPTVETAEKPKKKSVICDICGFKAKSLAGIIAHSRKHRRKK